MFIVDNITEYLLDAYVKPWLMETTLQQAWGKFVSN
jgi:hypothetical protein